MKLKELITEASSVYKLPSNARDFANDSEVDKGDQMIAKIIALIVKLFMKVKDRNWKISFSHPHGK